MSTIRPLTKQVLNHHVHNHDKGIRTSAAGTSSGATAATIAAAAAAHPRMSETKLELVLNYIENQLNIPQGNLPMTEASREFIRKTNNKDGQGTNEQSSAASAETDEATSQQHQHQHQQYQRRRGKRTSLRKDLHGPAKATPNTQPGTSKSISSTSGVISTSANCFSTIQIQPSRKKESKRHLGIFNKGKAVASKSADTALPKSFAYWKDIDTEIQYAHTSSTSSNNPCSNGILANDNLPVLPVPGCSYAPYSEEPAATPLSPPTPCGEMDCEPDKHDFFSALMISGGLDFDVETTDPLLSENLMADDMDRSRSHDASPTRQSGARLLASIEEYLNQDDKNGSSASRQFSLGLGCLSEGECLDISALFDEHENECTPQSNSHNMSIPGLSEFGSGLFASEDVRRLRHPGEITVSDFGNSRYGPGFHGLDMYALTGQSRGSLESVDTLPEYVCQEDHPPPYLSFENAPYTDGESGYYSREFLTPSRTHIGRSHNSARQRRQRPSSWLDPTDDEARSGGRLRVGIDEDNYNRIRRSRSTTTTHRTALPVLGAVYPPSQDQIDFRFFPRQIG
ncbi:hypothetical protein IWW48_001195 [Coemansia sp. RSA 1200]|nr:hypothetical protein IWW48_001195 [Coemansia sp. RSA 1200]